MSSPEIPSDLQTQSLLSWKDVLRPGQADDFFISAGLPPFDPHAKAFSPSNAWWLSELCRWIYSERNECNESPLKKFGLKKEYTAEAPLRHTLLTSIDSKSEYTVLVFQGTQELVHWLDNLNAFASDWEGTGQVHTGFYRLFSELWPTLEPVLQSCKEPLFFTGHSLGAAIATLAAAHYPPQALYTFGSPRVGNTAFSNSIAHLNHYRVVNHADSICSLPLPGKPNDYCHAGEMHYLKADGQLTTTPELKSIFKDWASAQQALLKSFKLQHLSSPPRFLGDHAPRGYSHGLAKNIFKTEEPV